MFFFDRYYFLLIIPSLLLAMWAQAKVQSTFARYQRVRSMRGMTGAQVARQILDDNGLFQVQVLRIAGNLTDHYDPRERVVRLSQGVYDSASIAAIGVAAHETGHAVQHATGYAPLAVRNAIIPVTQIGSQLSMPLILMGVLFTLPSLTAIGILCFSLVTIFQLVTLPVEFNASRRALDTLAGREVLVGEELNGAQQVLNAAAMTYVAALITSAAQLLRLVLLFGNRGRRD